MTEELLRKDIAYLLCIWETYYDETKNTEAKDQAKYKEIMDRYEITEKDILKAYKEIVIAK